MKSPLFLLFSLSLVAPSIALAQAGIADAQAFAASPGGTSKAMGGVSATSGSQNVPNYTTTAPEANYFANGRGNLTGPGQNKIINCQGTVPTNAYAGQDCNAINFLKGQPSGWALNGQSPDVQNVVSQSRDPINNSQAYNGTASGSSCRVVTRNIGATYDKVICSSNMSTTFAGCTAQLSVAVVNDYSCPSTAISGPVDSSVAGASGKVCQTQVITQKLRCEAGTVGPRDANLLLDEFGFAVRQGPPLMVCDTFGNTGDGYALISSTPAIPYDDIQIVEVPATATQRQVDSWTGTCEPFAARASANYKPFPDCQQQSTACTSGPQTRIVDGVSVTRPCWDTAEQYACQGSTMVGSCPATVGRSCTLGETVCRARDASGKCITEDQVYSCLNQPPQTITANVCGDPAACEANPASCFDTTHPPDADFAKAVGMVEATRQGGVYGGNFLLFNGSQSSCTLKLAGGVVLKSCCSGQPGGSSFTNASTIGRLGTQAAMTIVTEAGRESLKAGSQFVYDALYSSSNPEWMKSGFDAMADWGGNLGDGVFNPSFSFYGFTFDFSFANGFEFTGFDPTSFAISVGIQLIQQWLSCSQQEQMTMIKIGANLCVHTGTSCTSRLFGFGMCLEDTQYHCCFNSVLAKVINRQGGAQIGRAASNCGGFTEAEFQAIDFSRIDFSEFLASISGPPTDGSGQAASQTAVNAARLTNSYYTRGVQR